jgi:hypothetical protein
MEFNEWDPDPLFQAVIEGDVEEVTRRLEAEPHLMEARDSEEEDRTLLMVAAPRGHMHLVRLLLEMGAEVNAITFYDMTALHFAVMQGHGEVVSMLLSSGADISKRDNEGFTALMLATWDNHLGVVQLLLQHMQGRGLDEQDSIEGHTALGWACVYGHVEICRTLLLAGADHTVGSYEEGWPQHRERYLECMALLEVSEWHARTRLAGRHAMYKSSRWPRACGVSTDRVSGGYGLTWDGGMLCVQWWGGELERGYVLHRARCLSELPPLPTGLATVSIPTYLTACTGPLPTVQVVPLAEGSNGAAGESEGKGEEEKDATLKYVLHDLAPELVIELMEGFHRYKESSRVP